MRVGSLFSGQGLGDFGFVMAGFDIAWQCEIDDYCQKLLAIRYPESKKYTDIKKINGKELEKVDIIAGGFPCQPFSVAGQQHGEDDDRNLWPEMLRIIKAVRPRYVVAENVFGIIPLYLDTVLADLGNAGYSAWPAVFSSHSLGAWHRRERLWIIGYPKHDGQPATKKRRSFDAGEERDSAGQIETLQPQRSGRVSDQQRQEISSSGGSGASHMANAKGVRRRKGTHNAGEERKETGRDFSGLSGETRPFDWKEYWRVEPDVGRMANGVADRVHRLKGLGNGQTPCSTYAIAEWLKEFDQNAKKRKS